MKGNRNKNTMSLFLILTLAITIHVVHGAASEMPATDSAKYQAVLALTPVGDDDDESGDLLTKTTGAASAMAHRKKIAALTAGPSA